MKKYHLLKSKLTQVLIVKLISIFDKKLNQRVCTSGLPDPNRGREYFGDVC